MNLTREGRARTLSPRDPKLNFSPETAHRGTARWVRDGRPIAADRTGDTESRNA